MTRLALAALLLAPLAALAQYAGPAVETCRLHAEREMKQAGGAPAAVAFDRDRHLNLDRYSRKVGSQPVASLLYGNGTITPAAGMGVQFGFVCLLASERQAVFFHWWPREQADPLVQCKGTTQGACLDALGQVLEQDLTQAYAQRLQESRELDARDGNEKASDAFRASNRAWLAYRDAECARRGGGAEARKACVIELGRWRLLDVR